MNKNYLVSGVVLVVIVLVVIFAWPKNKNEALAPVTSNSPVSTIIFTTAPSPTNTATPSPEVIVEYTTSGFSPKTITVNKGDTVRFVNKTDGRMSVASDSHPTHDIYPEFDQFKTSYKGLATFDFVFDKTGTWNYHNHAQASHTGVVIVK